MTTRDDQIRAAREFAERNPEWRWTGNALVGPGRAVLWFPQAVQTYWVAFPAFSDRPLTGTKGGVRRFRSPASAARALGFDVKE